MRFPQYLTAGLFAVMALSAVAVTPAQANGLSDAEKSILNDVLKEVLGIEDEEDRSNRKDKKGLPPGLAKGNGLPPGLAKRHQLPPGLAKRLDDDLESKLLGRDVDITKDGLIIRDKNTGAIVSVIREIMKADR